MFRRLQLYGPNSMTPKKRTGALGLFLGLVAVCILSAEAVKRIFYRKSTPHIT